MARHGYDDDDFDIVDADEWNQYDSYAMRRAPQQTQIHMTQQMTTKVAPAYDGRTSFFAFEDAIDDWCDITELEPEKRGPALRNRLEGDAQQYKRLLDREMLRDPQEGVNYFKRFLRPHFIKGAQNVFLYRFMQFMKYNRGTMDLQKWMTRFQLTGNRLIESWMDLLPEATVTSPEAILFVAQKRQEHDRDQQERAEVAAASGAAPHIVVPWSDELALVAFRQYQEHRTYRRPVYLVLDPSFIVNNKLFLTKNGVVLYHGDIPFQYLHVKEQLPTIACKVIHQGRGHSLPPSVTGGSWHSRIQHGTMS